MGRSDVARHPPRAARLPIGDQRRRPSSPCSVVGVAPGVGHRRTSETAPSVSSSSVAFSLKEREESSRLGAPRSWATRESRVDRGASLNRVLGVGCWEDEVVWKPSSALAAVAAAVEVRVGEDGLEHALPLSFRGHTPRGLSRPLTKLAEVTVFAAHGDPLDVAPLDPGEALRRPPCGTRPRPAADAAPERGDQMSAGRLPGSLSARQADRRRGRDRQCCSASSRAGPGVRGGRRGCRRRSVG
jgi:hypothetical protein